MGLTLSSLSFGQDQLSNTKSVLKSRYISEEMEEAANNLPLEYKGETFLTEITTKLISELSKPLPSCRENFIKEMKAYLPDIYYPGILTELRNQQKIDDVMFIPLYRELSPFDSESVLLKNLKLKSSCDTFDSLNFVRNTYLGTKKSISSTYANEKVKKTKGLNRQVYLYQTYTENQILILAKIYIEYTSNISIKSSAEVIIHKENNITRKIPLNVTSQARLAAYLIHSDLEELKTRPLFEGKNVSFEDLIMAGFETGAINGDEINTLLDIKELWDPKLTSLEKINKLLLKVGTPAMILVPAPFNQLITLGLLFIESKASKDKIKSARDRGISIF